MPVLMFVCNISLPLIKKPSKEQKIATQKLYESIFLDIFNNTVYVLWYSERHLHLVASYFDYVLQLLNLICARTHTRTHIHTLNWLHAMSCCAHFLSTLLFCRPSSCKRVLLPILYLIRSLIGLTCFLLDLTSSALCHHVPLAV